MQQSSIVMAETSRHAAFRQRRRRHARAIEWRNQTIVELLAELKRVRGLSAAESELYERTLAGLGPKRSIWRWTAKEDRRLILLIKRRGHSLRIKPFETNREVLELAESMGRTYEAVHKRIQRLRKRMDCPNAKNERGE